MKRLRNALIFSVLLSLYGAYCQIGNDPGFTIVEICSKNGTDVCNQGCRNNTVWVCNANSSCSLIKPQHSRNQQIIDELSSVLHWCPILKNSTQVCLKETCLFPTVYNFMPRSCIRQDSGKLRESAGTSKRAIISSGQSFTEEQFEREDFKCERSQSFKIDCNTCWCRSDGQGAKYCTRIACKPKTYTPVARH